MQSLKTPGTPKFLTVRLIDGSGEIFVQDHKLFHSGIGMLLYLMKQLRADIANTTQELSKFMDSVNPAAFLEMHHVIKYALNTINLGLKIESNGNEKLPWDIICFSNSDYSGDPITRRSVSEFIWYV